MLRSKEIEFQVPTDVSDLIVTERCDGNATTDFGAPGVMLTGQTLPMRLRWPAQNT